jgi:hypothetical protein
MQFEFGIAVRQGGRQSIRAMAEALGMSKSSVHRHQRALQRRQQQPESALWESPAGAAWLKILVLATVFVFGCQRGVGCESVSQFFHLLRLDRPFDPDFPTECGSWRVVPLC